MAEIRVNSTGGVKLFDADDSHYAQIKAGTISSNTDVLELGSSAVVAGTKVDLNGQELILDADADTSITADTDDQIDVRIAGADDFQFTANTFTAQSGSSIVVPDGGLTFGSTAISSTAAELNILDGVTSTTAELNILDGVTSTASELNLLDGGTSVGSSITLADADGVVVNDGGTMKTIPASDFATYASGNVVKLAQSRSSSGANAVAFDNIWDDSTYSFYKVFACLDPANDSSEIRFRWHDSSGELTSSVYRGQSSRQIRDGSNSASGQDYGYWGQSYATLSWATSSDYYGNAFIVMDLFPRTYGQHATRCNYTLSTQDDGSTPQEHNYVGGFLYDATTSLDNGGFRFEHNTGQIAQHDICVYGFKK